MNSDKSRQVGRRRAGEVPLKTESWNLAENVRELIAFRNDRGWAKFHRPKDLAAAMAIEAAELQELFLWEGARSAAAVRQDHRKLRLVEDEVADIAIYLLFLANELRIDLSEVIRRKHIANIRRFPVNRQKGQRP